MTRLVGGSHLNSASKTYTGEFRALKTLIAKDLGMNTRDGNKRLRQIAKLFRWILQNALARWPVRSNELVFLGQSNCQNQKLRALDAQKAPAAEFIAICKAHLLAGCILLFQITILVQFVAVFPMITKVCSRGTYLAKGMTDAGFVKNNFLIKSFMFRNLFIRKGERSSEAGTGRQANHPSETNPAKRRPVAKPLQNCGPVVFSMPTNAFNSQLG